MYGSTHELALPVAEGIEKDGGEAVLRRALTRFAALEGRMLALSAGALLDLDDIARDSPL